MDQCRPLVLSRTTTPQTSNACLFITELDPQHVYCAHGVDGGTIVVQQAPAGAIPPAAAAGSARPSLDRGSPHHPRGGAAGGAGAAGDGAAGGAGGGGGGECGDPFETVLLIDQPHLGDDECVHSISWGGGPLAALSAATKHGVALLSLAPFFEQRAAPPHAAPAAAAHGAHGARMPSSCHTRLGVFKAKAPVLSHQWTHDGRGLLVSDAKGGVVMLQVDYDDRGREPSGAPQAGAPGGERGEEEEGGDEAEEEGAGGGGAGGGAAAGWRTPRVRELWQARADAAQDLIAAGARAAGPCASVSRDSPQRVVIWWPSVSPKTGEYVVGAEVIRHPVRAVHLEWSPALAGGGSGDGGERQQGGDGGGGVEDGGGGEAGGEPPSARHPALMTVGADGVIRVWVEVVMADMDEAALLPPGLRPQQQQQQQQPVGSPPKAAAQARVMSQFCLTLVVEPPAGAGAAPGALPGMAATWARPLRAPPGSAGGGAADAGGAHRVLWLLASHCGPAAAPPPPPAAAPHTLPASPPRGPGAAHLAPAARGTFQQPAWVETVFLWAIDGLSGVVLRGIAQNAITASKLSAPRAFLWGRAPASPRWRAPAALAQPGARQTLAAWLQTAGGVPLVHCSQQFLHAGSGYHELRHFLTQPLPLQPAEPGAPPTCGVVVRPCHARARAPEPAEWRAFAAHPAADVAAAVARDGRVAIWGLAPVELLPLPGGAAAAAPPPGRADERERQQGAGPPASWAACGACCWLPTPPGAGPYLLATCGAGRLQVCAVTVAPAPPPCAAGGGAGGSAGGAAPGLRVTGIELLADAPLPACAHSVRSLSDVCAELVTCGAAEGVGVGVAAAVTLVALASGSKARGERERDLWLVWRARVEAASEGGAPASGDGQQHGQQQEGQQQQRRRQWAVALSPAEASSVEAAVAAAGACSGGGAPPATSGPTHSGGGGSGDDEDAGVDIDDEAAGLSCVHRPSAAGPFLMTGDVQGRMQLWQVLSADAAAALGLAGSDGGEGADGGGGGAVQLLQQSGGGMLGVHLGGVTVGVALCTGAGYAAAAVTCGETDVEDAIYIWSAEGARAPPPPPGAPPSALRGGPFALDSLLPLEDTASALAWLDSAGLPPLLAVGFASGALELYGRDRSGQWNALAACETHLTISHLGSSWAGLPLAVAGGQVMLLSNLVSAPPRCAAAGAAAGAAAAAAASRRALAAALAAAGGEEEGDSAESQRRGELEEGDDGGGGGGGGGGVTEALTHAALASAVVPLHHPDAIAALVARGRLAAASRVLRRLLGWLRADADGEGGGGGGGGPDVGVEGLLEGGLHAAPGAAAVVRFRDRAVRLALGLEEPSDADAAAEAAAAAAAAPAAAGVVGGSGAPQRQPQAPVPAPAATSLDTGMLDMSAFGGDFGGFGGAAEPPSPPKPAPAASPLDTGMLDMSAFGGDFGGFGGGQPSPRAQPAAPAPVPAASPLDTGMLDMSAFGGDFDGFGGGQPPSPPAPAPAANALETGMLDMSAFGGDFGGFGGPAQQPAPAPAAPPTPEPAGAPGRPSAFAGWQREQPAAAAAAAADAARGGSETTPPPGPVDPEALAAVEARFPRVGGPGAAAAAGGGAGARLLVLSDAEASELAALLGVPPPRDPSAAAEEAGDTADGGSGGGGGGGAGMAYYRRLLSDAGAAGGDAAARGGGGGGGGGDAAAGGDPAARRAAARRLRRLGLSRRHARELCALAMALAARTYSAGQSSGGAAGWGGGGFGPSSSFRRLAAPAPALAPPAPQPPGGEAAGQELPGPSQALGAAGRAAVANVRLALLRSALGDDGGGGGGGGAGPEREAAERDRLRFAAAVARLFSPVSVSRSAASVARGAALLAHYPTAAERAPGASDGGAPPAGLPPAPWPLRSRAGSAASAAAAAAAALGDGPAASGISFGGSARSRSRAAVRAGPGALGARSMKSSMSVASMLSFSSLRDERGDDNAAARVKLGSRTWREFVGLLPGLAPLHLLWALGCDEPGALLEVLLPLAPDMPEHSGGADGNGSGGGAGGAGGASMANAQQVARTAITWPKLRALGAGFWLADPDAARQAMEQLARQQYASSKDPHDCALAYVALGKKAVLQGLFRSAGNKKVAEFLSRDFSQEASRAAACKNAFHLLGQHRHQLAAAFFLLGGSQWDAVSLLAREAADPQLALMVARLVEGRPGGPLQQRLVDEELALLAEADADPCTACLTAWLRGDAPAAVQRLLASLAGGPPPAAGASGSGGGGGSADARGGGGRRSRLALVGLGGGGGGAPPGAAPGGGRPLGGGQAALLDWALLVGVRRLGGAVVSGLLPCWLHALALQCARAAEVAGLPLAAAEALALADAVGDPAGAPRGQLPAALDLVWRARLAAECLLLQAAPGAAAAAGGGAPRGWPLGELIAAGGGAPRVRGPWSALPAPEDAAGWSRLVRERLPPLLAAAGLSADAAAAEACLRRHAAALRPVTWLHASRGSLDPPPGAAAAAPRASSGAAGEAAGPPTADAALQICLSRADGAAAAAAAAAARGGGWAAGSSAAGSTGDLSCVNSLMASLPSLRRRASADALAPGAAGSPAAPGARPPRVPGGPPAGGRLGGERARAAGGERRQAGLLGDAWDVAASDGGDKLRAVAAARGGGYGIGPASACRRPFAFAAARGGIRCGELAAPAGEGGSPTYAMGRQGSASILSGLMQQVLDHVRWPPDPWVVGEYPNRRSHSYGSAALSQVATPALAAHPQRPLFVSGAASGHIYIWQYGAEGSRAAYVPVTAQVSKRTPPHEAVAAPHWGAAAALRFSRSGARFGAVGEGGLVGLWRQDFISAADGLGHAEWLAHCLGRHGADLDFLGDTGSQIIVAGQGDKGGVVALWDTLAPPSSALAADARLRGRAAPTSLALLPARAGGPGHGAALVVGDDGGGLTAFDVRMLSDGKQLWTASPHPGGGGVAALAAWDGEAGEPLTAAAEAARGGGRDAAGGGGGAPAMRLADVVVSGGRDGSIALVNVHSGSTVQLIERAHYTERRGLLGGRLGGGGSPRAGDGALPARRAAPAGAAAAAVTGLAACPEGLMSVGADGVVRFHPLSQVWA